MTRQSQVSDRYIKSVELLGSIDTAPMASRLGAIYALGEVARVSQTHHQPIMELLNGYVRERAGPAKNDPGRSQDTSLTERPQDLQAAITVMGRRNLANDTNSPLQFNFRDLNLSDLRFDDLHFEYADFRRASIRDSLMIKTFLCGANFDDSKMLGAQFEGADLRLTVLNNPFRIVQSRLNGAWIYVTDPRSILYLDGDLKGAALSDSPPDGRHGDLTGAHVFQSNTSNDAKKAWQDYVHHELLGDRGAFPDGCAKPGAAVERFLDRMPPDGK